MTNTQKRINGTRPGDFTETERREIEAHEAGPFTYHPKIRPHEEAAAAADRRTAETLKLGEHDTEWYVKNCLMKRRQDEHIRRQEQLRIGQQLTESPLPRIVVTLLPPQVTIDGKPTSLSEDEAACFQAVVDASGHLITNSQITDITHVARPDRKFKHIRRLLKVIDPIESIPGKGNRIRPEWVE